MQPRLTWTWPRGTSLRYSFKVSIATLLGYLLSFGELSYSAIGAFTAALVVGGSRGEDVGSAANRARGSIAGMLVGVAFSHMPMPPALAVALAIGATAYICMGCKWGVPTARIGASLCAVTVLLHANDAFVYTAMRVANTLIGIAAGLAVSHFVLPVRGRDAMARAVQLSLDEIAKLLGTVARPDQPLHVSQCLGVFDSMIALEKAVVDARKEIGGEAEALRDTARHVALACLGAMSAGVAGAELRNTSGVPGDLTALYQQAAALAERARSVGPGGPPPSPAHMSEAQQAEVEMQGLAHGLSKVHTALGALGR